MNYSGVLTLTSNLTLTPTPTLNLILTLILILTVTLTLTLILTLMSDVETEMLAMEREGHMRVQEWCLSCGNQLMKLRNSDLFCCSCDMTVMTHTNGQKKNSSDTANGKWMVVLLFSLYWS